jgi:hypothetical protein
MITDPQPAVATERRAGDRRVDPEELPPEFLAVLLLCGGETRTTDGVPALVAKPRDRRQSQDF